MPLIPELLLDLVFPRYCQSCGIEGIYLCIKCQTEVKSAINKCPVCAKPSLLGRAHESCWSKSKPLRGLLVATNYDQEPIRKLIWYFKYNSVKEAGDVLAQIMIDSLVGWELIDYFSEAVVISVPLHKWRQRMRGFNQAEYLAARLATKLNLEFLPILKKVKNTKSQVELEKEERLKNLDRAFMLISDKKLIGKKCLLIDDVASTSSTLQECAKLISKQGAAEIWGLVVAKN